MNEYTIREYLPSDREGMLHIWHEVFGDSPEFIEGFLTRLPGFGTAAAALCGEEIVGAAYILTGMTLAGENISEKKCGYIYAVAVMPEHRKAGLGAGLTRLAAELGRRDGAQMICTLPAEDSLYAWYEGLIGTENVLHLEVKKCSAQGRISPRRLGAQEYFRIREERLKNTPHLRLNPECAEFHQFFCEYLGGGLFEAEGALLSCYCTEGLCIVTELINPDAPRNESIAAALAAHLGAAEVLYRVPAKTGRPYLAADTDLPEDCVWNISFD